MEIKCNYCGSMMDDKALKCPNCGATNDNVHRMVDNTPHTIAELQAWYEKMNLPPYETTRFFIGQDYKQPRAFGIYQDSNGEFVVYKNKDNGQRAVRYRGTDEAYAVNELYLKLKSEILNQKEGNRSGKTPSGRNRVNMGRDDYKGLGIVLLSMFGFGFISVINELIPGFLLALIIALVGSFIITFAAGTSGKFEKIFEKKDGSRRSTLIYLVIAIILFSCVITPLHRYLSPKYYRHDDEIYCKYRGDWYSYDYTYGDYDEVTLPSGYSLEEVNTGSLYSDQDDWNSSSFTEFKDSNYYDDNFTSDSSSSDSDYSWSSSDSWDSGSTDFSSDW